MNVSMSIRRIWILLKKDIALGPRSPFVLFAVILPLALTLAIQLIFGDIFSSKPVIAAADAGSSTVMELLLERDDIYVISADDANAVEQLIAERKAAAGLILPQNFDADVKNSVKNGTKPLLDIVFSGESSDTDRMVLTAAVVDSIRALQDSRAPIRVEEVFLGKADTTPLLLRLVPLMTIYAFLLAGMFVPASSLVEEREKRTLSALLATPVSFSETAAAKAAFGVLLNAVMVLAILAMNSAIPSDLAALFVILIITSVFWALLGIVIGLLASNSQTLFAIIKGSGALFVGPVVFYIFPEWPQWIAKVFPSFWAIDPLWKILAEQASIRDVSGSLIIVAVLILVCMILISRLQKRLYA